jgi:hypothetical protein
MPDETLDLDKLFKLVGWLRTLTEKEDEAARRMGIDPEKDLLIVPKKMFPKLKPGAFVPNLPKWLKISEYVDQPYVAKGVRDPRKKS